MNHFKQSLVIEATPAAVYAAITTTHGLRGWWTPDCTVDNRVGGELRLRFGPHSKQMRITQLSPEREVRWLCSAAHLEVDRFARKDEWVGTQIVFTLVPQGAAQTRLDFEHIGLVPALECHEVCVDGWRHFLESLRLFAQTGQGRPYEQSGAAATAQ